MNTNGQDIVWAADLVSSGGSLTKSGNGKLSLNGTNTFDGPTLVSGGILAVNSALPNTSTVTVTAGGTLGGSGSISALTTIEAGGKLAPGNSPGVDVFSGGLTMNLSSTYEFELIANVSSESTGIRGTDFDGTDVTGGTLTIQSGVTANLIFNSTGSTVDWADTFWTSNHQWRVFANANAPTVASASIFDVINVSVDAQGDLIGSTGAFSYSQIGNDIYLQFTAVPEPGTAATVLGGLVALGVGRRRRTYC